MNVISKLPFAYQIKPSQRARRARIKVSPGKVEVVVPPDVSEHSIHQFLRLKQQWVLDALKRLQARAQQTKSLAPVFYRDGADIPFQGQSYKLSVRPTHLKRIKIEFAEQFIVSVPKTMMNREHSEEIRAALIRWLKHRTQSQVEHFVQKHTGRHQLWPRSVKIKTQRSRWGSCGIHNDININWLLILAPPAVLEYVVVHELCHIKIRNHSPQFWLLVSSHLPDYQRHRHWLKEHGANLMMGL
ncbi:MAG: M48 family metallopeptidase [Gammaproteobacteria bacterium]